MDLKGAAGGRGGSIIPSSSHAMPRVKLKNFETSNDTNDAFERLYAEFFRRGALPTTARGLTRYHMPFSDITFMMR